MNRVGSRSFAFTFIIKDKKHTFTASYSKLHELHQSLKKTEIFTIAFENAPSFPSNPSVIGHEECKDALLIYFKTLTSNIAVLKHELFQNGINVSKDLQQLLASIDENQPFDVTVTTMNDETAKMIETEWRELRGNGTRQQFVNESNTACNSVHFKDCNCILRISVILKHYRHASGDIMRHLPEYSLKQLIEDYLHVKEYHFDVNPRTAFQLSHYLNKSINKPCDINHCVSFERNNRNRGDTTKSRQVNKMYDANSKVLKWLDLVHVFLLHSDIFGRYQMLKHDDDDDSKQNYRGLYQDDGDDDGEGEDDSKLNIQVNSIFKDKLKLINNKFVTNVKDKTDTKVDDKQPNLYGFGEELYWWRNTDHTWCKGKIVDPKYKTFKEELLTNQTYCITIDVFDEIVEKAKELYDTTKCKKMQAYSRSGWNPICGIEAGANVTLNHILCIIFYTDCGDLCFNMRKSFRKHSNTDTLKDVMERNSEYAIFSRLLFEVICLYGDAVQIKNKFFHGLSSRLLFDSYDVRFYAPLSTTVNLTVAMNFSEGGAGTILQLGCDTPDVYYALNVEWLSTYPNEEERLFLNARFSIRNMMFDQHKYSGTMKALHLYQKIMTGSTLQTKLLKLKFQAKLSQLMNNIIEKQSEHGITELNYFEKLIVCFIENKSAVWFNDTFIQQYKNEIDQSLLDHLSFNKNKNNFVNYIKMKHKDLKFKAPIYCKWRISGDLKNKFDNKQQIQTEVMRETVGDLQREFKFMVMLDREYRSDKISCRLVGVIAGIDVIESTMELFVPEINYRWESSPIQSIDSVLIGVSFFSAEDVLKLKYFTWNLNIKILRGFDKNSNEIKL
eukprot:122440_1